MAFRSAAGARESKCAACGTYGIHLGERIYQIRVPRAALKRRSKIILLPMGRLGGEPIPATRFTVSRIVPGVTLVCPRVVAQREEEVHGGIQ